MKSLKYFAVILILFSISCNRNPYRVEDKLYQCMVDKFAEKGVDLEVEIESFENYLIDKQMLESKNGKSYHLLFDRMINSNEENYIDYDRFDKLRKLELKDLYSDDCLKGLDAVLIKESKFYKLSSKFGDKIRSEGALDVDEAKLIYNTVIKEDDYKHSFNKVRMLLIVLYVSDVEAGIPPTLNDSIGVDKYVGFADCEIEIEGASDIYFNNSCSSLVKLKISLEQFINENTPEYTISVYQKPTTTYGLYINVMNLIQEIITEFRNEKSIELFGVPFLDNSNKDQLLKIEAMFPKHVLEPPIKNTHIYM